MLFIYIHGARYFRCGDQTSEFFWCGKFACSEFYGELRKSDFPPLWTFSLKECVSHAAAFVHLWFMLRKTIKLKINVKETPSRISLSLACRVELHRKISYAKIIKARKPALNNIKANKMNWTLNPLSLTFHPSHLRDASLIFMLEIYEIKIKLLGSLPFWVIRWEHHGSICDVSE